MRKILYIINPVSGSGAGASFIEKIREKMNESEILYEIKISARVGQITELVKNGLDEYTDIIIVGGDGSIIEALNGVNLESNVRFGIIPSGTGNDFARLLYKEKSIEYYLNVIIKGETQRTDLGSVNKNLFINVCCVGIDSAILLDAEKLKKHIKGPSAYLISSIKNLLFYKAKKINIKIDELTLRREMVLIAVSNGKYFGGGMMIAPDAALNSGEFEICIVNKINPLKLMRLFPSIFKGEHVHIKPYVEIFRGKQIKIEAIEEQLLFEADGNIMGLTPISIEVAVQKINIIGDF